MTEEAQKQDILKWIREFVEKPNALLNNWPPCPYAKEARLKNKVRICMTSLENLEQTFSEEVLLLESSNHEVSVVALNKGVLMSVTEAKELIHALRHKWSARDIYILMDHPEIKEVTRGLCMNQGTYQIFFLQRLSSLKKAEGELEKAGYYSDWDSDYYQRVVQSRKAFCV